MNILIIFTSYLLGSLPTGFLIGKYLKNIDLRTIGSGSTGATNVLRNVGKWPALFVFIIDVGKGLIAVKIAQYYTDQGLIEVIAGYPLSQDIFGQYGLEVKEEKLLRLD